MRLRFTRSLKTREWLLIVAAAVVLAGLPLVKRVIVPAYDNWRSLREEVGRLEGEMTELVQNIAIAEKVRAEFARLGDHAAQRDTDEVTLSAFLRDVEATARKPNVTLVNMKPMPVDETTTHKTYRVHLAVAGRLADVTQFVADLLGGAWITSLDGFTVRGVQDGRTVECNLQVSMLRLLPPDVRRKPVKAKAAATTKGKHDVH